MNKRKYNKIDGWLVIDKPLNYSSAAIVNKMKYLLKPRKIGHAGTLDPLASGVLPIAIGEATKTINYLVDKQKEYEFEVKFGYSTTTDDKEGEINSTSDKLVTKEEILNILPQFIGKISQIPPIFSALWVNGKRSYELAREGKNVELLPREIYIENLTLLQFNEKEQTARFDVTCSKGTYIRSLGRDIATAIGSLAYISSLQRKRVGKFSLFSSISLDKFEEIVHNGELNKYLSSVDIVLDDIPALNVTEEEATKIKMGQSVKVTDHKSPRENIFKVFCNDKFVALGQIHGDKLIPIRVFNI